MSDTRCNAGRIGLQSLMRRAVLWRSTRRFLDADEELLAVAFLWRRHRMFVPVVLAVGLLAVAGALSAGVASSAASVAIGLAAVAVAASATTEHRVLAVTSSGLVLLAGGRVRQVATGLVERLPDSTAVERVANNLVISDWRVGDARYSTLRRFESTMAGIAARYPA